MALSVQPIPGMTHTSPFPFVIAGPCAAESREQVLQIAKSLAANGGVNALRAGIWKPRTRPGSFEGLGEAALPWLKEASQLTGLPVWVEVAHPAHIGLVLKHGIQGVWIGARTTVNPFMVEELANALADTNLPVLVKNPVNPDLELWTGALERLNRKGIQQLAAVHRGFSGFEKTVYRNTPNWQIPIELKRRFPELPIFCDPSHICGHTELIPEVSQTALDLGFDGLMIESHPDPVNALSDARQQLRPEQLASMLQALVVRSFKVPEGIASVRLNELRGEVDRLDAAIVDLLTQRLRTIEAIGKHKLEHELPIFQPERWNQVLQNVRTLAAQLGLEPAFVERLFHSIHQESIEKQKAVFRQSAIQTHG